MRIRRLRFVPKVPRVNLNYWTAVLMVNFWMRTFHPKRDVFFVVTIATISTWEKSSTTYHDRSSTLLIEVLMVVLKWISFVVFSDINWDLLKCLILNRITLLYLIDKRVMRFFYFLLSSIAWVSWTLNLSASDHLVVARSHLRVHKLLLMLLLLLLMINHLLLIWRLRLNHKCSFLVVEMSLIQDWRGWHPLLIALIK